MRIVIILGLGALFSLWQVKAHAITAPLAFGVTADSNINPNTVVYRDGSSLSTIALQSQTTTQLAARIDPTFTTFYAQESVAGVLVTNTFNLCMSTAPQIASYVYVAVSTSAAAIAGTSCSK